MSNPRILIAGIGNIFFGDDAFGVEVAQRLARRSLPKEVQVKDFGIRGLDLAYALLEPYQTIILPDGGGYGGSLGANGVRRLKDWVQAGGTLVAIGGAIQFLAAPATGLLSTAEENGLKEGAAAPRGGNRDRPGGAPGRGDRTARYQLRPAVARSRRRVRRAGKQRRAGQADRQIPGSAVSA